MNSIGYKDFGHANVVHCLTYDEDWLLDIPKRNDFKEDHGNSHILETFVGVGGGRITTTKRRGEFWSHP